jgi:hypothetical protein
MFCAAAVSNGEGRVMMMVAVPQPRSPGAITLKLRDDGKAIIADSAGNCLAAWGYEVGIQAGC